MSTSGATTDAQGLPAKWLREIRRQSDVVLKWRPGKRDAAEIFLLASTLPLYYLVRGLTNTDTRIDEAVQRGIDIINIEKSFGIFWEVEMQGWVLGYQWLVDFFNFFYLFGHLPVIGVLAVWMYFWHKPQYLLMRNAFLLSGAIALIFYVNFPTAPPRLLPDALGFGFVDTVFDQYNTGRPLTLGAFVNEYAAFPSMHIGWNMLAGIAVWMASKNIFVRAFAVLMPAVMTADIIFTGNHYIIDALAGFVVMMIGLGIAVGGKMLATHIVSPNSKAAREKGWVPWMYWLCGVVYERGERRQSNIQAA